MKDTMTYAVALTTAIDAMKNTNPEVSERLSALLASLSRRSERSDEAKARQSAKRKEQTAKARGELMEKVLPILREVLTHTQQGMTAKDIFSDAKGLPQDFTANKVQYILLHEMASEVEKIEKKGEANRYRLIEK